MPGEVLPKSPLPSPERDDQTAYEAKAAAKGVPHLGAVREPLHSGHRSGYPIRARTAKTEILVNVHLAPSVNEKYTVYVDDNFHYMDESERYKLGIYEGCASAIAACKGIVDEFLLDGYKKGVTEAQLHKGYLLFGEDPFIIADDPDCKFSARDYARQRCKELCKGK